MSSSSELSLDEIYKNAKEFSETHKNDKKENAQSQTFLNEFFEVFGIDRKTVAKFERNPDNDPDRMDLFWSKNLLVEMKSLHENLDEAMDQALNYYKKLKMDELPRYILACDFQNWYLRDKKDNTDYFFTLSELADNLGLFGFITGRSKVIPADPVNIKSAEMLGKIFDSLKASKYASHHVEYFLTRLVFCLFADDTGIFGDYGKFQTYLKEQTAEDGSDLGRYLMHLFQILNQHQNDRSKFLDPKTRSFPYINGALFEKPIDFPSFNSKMRQLLIDAGSYDWSKVSPAIFGNMFQTVMDQDARREMGAHYTSEENILKVIKPLFLDKLNEEFEKIDEILDDSKKDRFIQFQEKLSNLKFLDPACGSGNFLVISYREIRRIEHRVIMKIHGSGKKRTDTDELSKVNVNQFYGIELIEFSVRIAETALWMMDHLMNIELSKRYGFSFRRIPIKKQPHIKWRDALEFDWNELLPSSKCSYILGNPPFYGANKCTVNQKEQTKRIADIGETGGTLDYVCNWFLKAAQYTNNVINIGFVSTNSITQGAQVNHLWNILFDKYNLKINFAYKEFKWKSEARNKAIVRVVIIGLSKNNEEKKRLFHYIDEKIIEKNPIHISPYLIGSDHQLPLVKNTSKSLNGFTKVIKGSQPRDNGHYIFTDDEKMKFLAKEPNAEFLFRPFVNAKEFLNNNSRWILKLFDSKPHELMNLPEIKKCIASVKLFRSNSTSKETRELDPKSYYSNVVPVDPFLVIPRVSSERREYIPLGYLKPPIIPSDATMIVENASLELFGLLTSKMHMIWVRLVGGKLETRLRYSVGMVYNTFPIPKSNYAGLKPYAEKILKIRTNYPDSTLVDLYDPILMPSDLKKAHLNLDRAVEKLYRDKPFKTDNERLVFLLEEYEKIRRDQNSTLD